MDKKTILWLKLMHIANQYWGCHQIPERSFFVVINYLYALDVQE